MMVNKNGRGKPYTLTPEGEEYLARAWPEREILIGEICSTLGIARTTTIYRFVRELKLGRKPTRADHKTGNKKTRKQETPETWPADMRFEDHPDAKQTRGGNGLRTKAAYATPSHVPVGERNV